QLSRCEAFYTFPGQLSFYIWTGKPNPTGLSVDDQLGLLSQEQQEHIISDLSVHSDMCVLTAPELYQFWDRGQLATDPPLLRYIESNFRPFAMEGPFTLLKREPLEKF